MNAREAYERVYPVTRIVDAYAAVTPWGGAELVESDSHAPVEYDAAAVVRDLLIDLVAEADVVVGSKKQRVRFEHQDFMASLATISPVALVAPSAERIDEFKGITHPSLPAFLEMMVTNIGMGLGLPLWILDQNQVRAANVVALKWPLKSFVFACERYRRTIARGVEEAFGGRVEWKRPLTGSSSLYEYASVYQAFCSELRLELTPLRAEATTAARLLAGPPLNMVTASELEAVERTFAACA